MAIELIHELYYKPLDYQIPGTFLIKQDISNDLELDLEYLDKKHLDIFMDIVVKRLNGEFSRPNQSYANIGEWVLEELADDDQHKNVINVKVSSPRKPRKSNTTGTLEGQLGSMIRASREDLKMSQGALGTKIRMAQTYVSNIELGKRKISLEELAEIGRHLKWSSGENEDAKDLLNQILGKGKGENEAMAAKEDPAMYGGIDMKSANLAMTIKRDGKGVPLPLAQQDMAQLSRIEGFEAQILSITPASALPMFHSLK